VALVAGGAAGWYVVTHVFDMAFAPDWLRVAATLGLASAVTLGIGVAGSIPALRARPARMLRTL
jgi:putative ABC transport system permease protein